MWLATGEKYSDAYKGGTFGSIKPKSNFDLDSNTWGAWEFGLKAERYNADNITSNSSAANGSSSTSAQRVQGSASCSGDLGAPTDGGWGAKTENTVNGCEASAYTYTAGIKWILNPNAMVKLNYSHTKFGHEWQHYDLDDARVIKKEDILMARTQITF
jgi:phosphate-selective porin OprO/OprP